MADLIDRLKARVEVVDDRWKKQLEAVADSPDDSSILDQRLKELRRLAEQSQHLHQLIHYQEHQKAQRELQEKSVS